MRKKIATLEVWLDTDTVGPSRSGWDDFTRQGKIELLTHNDMFPIESKDDLADVFAHELGHFIGGALRLPKQVAEHRDTFVAHITGQSTPAILEGEKEAWDLAGKMRKINPKNRDPRLESYKI